jgi:hypothetical protein
MPYDEIAMSVGLKQTLLHRAAKLVGGPGNLATRLNVPLELLQAWMDGVVDMPDVRMPRLSAILKKASDQTHG